MSDFAYPVQTAVYSRLTSVVSSATIYDDVPRLSNGQPDANFPYIVIGDDDLQSWDTDDTLGATVVITLHIWSRYQGKKEVKQVMQDIYSALNRQAGNLSATGYRFVDSLHDFSTVMDDPDGATRHGVCRYQITVEKE